MYVCGPGVGGELNNPQQEFLKICLSKIYYGIYMEPDLVPIGNRDGTFKIGEFKKGLFPCRNIGLIAAKML